VTGAAALWLAVGATMAVLDWAAVHLRRRLLELVCKPATLVAVVLAALALDVDDSTVQAWFVAALVASLVGDVFLLWADRQAAFVAGLAAFLAGHVCYVVGFWVEGVDAVRLLAGLAVVGVAVATIGRRIVGAVTRSEHRELAGPVVAYVAVISAMVASAIGRGEALAVAGAALFYASDATIAWNRFIGARPHGRIAIIVTYHLAQLLLVLSLTT
jgi:uncharacterized membrane protein YhhN